MRTAVSIVAVLALATAAQATLTMSVEVAADPTPGVPGYVTYNLVATGDATEWPGGFTILIGGDGQVCRQVNPYTLSTIFADNNTVFPAVGEDPLADTQFPWDSSGLATIAASNSESGTHLKGDWAFLGGPPSESVVVAQVCTDGQVTYEGIVVMVEAGGGPQVGEPRDIGGVIPEPATLALLAIGGCGVLLRRKR